MADDEIKLNLAVGFNYVEDFALDCFTLKKTKELLQRQETHTGSPAIRHSHVLAEGGTGAYSAAIVNVLPV